MDNKSVAVNGTQNSGQTKATDIKNDIIRNDKYFSSLIDLIPAKIYFEGNEEILQTMEDQKRNHLGDNERLTAKARRKLFRLDPTSGNKKISEIANNFYNKSKKNNPNDKMSELRQKLNEKISLLKSKRGQKPNAKRLRESKKQRKRENAMRASKQKGFSKKQISEQNGLPSEPSLKKVKLEHKSETKFGPNLDNLPKIYNKEGNMVFSKFDFVSPMTDHIEKKKSKKDKLQKLLVKTKKEEQKLTELEATNAPKAKEVKEKKMWRNAISKSEGIKVKDKSVLIEKSLRKQKKMKQKSGQKWAERNETTEKSKQKKQEKRQRNINIQKEKNKELKVKRLKKKGRYIETK